MVRTERNCIIDLLLFFLWVVSACVLICLVLLMNGFPSLISIYRVFFEFREVQPTIIVPEEKLPTLSVISLVVQAERQRYKSELKHVSKVWVLYNLQCSVHYLLSFYSTIITIPFYTEKEHATYPKNFNLEVCYRMLMTIVYLSCEHNRQGGFIFLRASPAVLSM